jgi:flavin-dependent dehydrogenase
MVDVLIAGAGPAGTVAALLLARAGARVLLIDRARFPRDKLCGDTLNPGAVALLRRLGLAGGALERALPLAGMRLTGPGAAVSARYPAPAVALALRRAALDQWLLETAVRAGVRFESGVTARRPLIDESSGTALVKGLVVGVEGTMRREVRLPATVTIAADGRSTVLGRALGLVRPTVAPRRWAYGTYVQHVDGMSDLGEMHVLGGGYIGVAPLPDGLVNVCVVTGPRPTGRTPTDVIRQGLAGHPELSVRFAKAEFVAQPRVLGPLAVDAGLPGCPGLLLAGDAAGFVDPLTGDGLHLAWRGAELAAEEAMRVLEGGDFTGAVRRLSERRRQILGSKLTFNRAVRWLVERRGAVRAASLGARIAPGVMRAAVRYAGDAR